MTVNPFGRFLRTRRVARNLSLRQVAEKVGISYVYLGEVERGVAAPMKRDKWPGLCEALGISIEELERHAEISRPLQLNLADAPPQYQSLAFALARSLEAKKTREIPAEEFSRILHMLRGDDDE